MKGYTVLELMIVMGTIAILSMMGLVGIRGASEREALAAASRQLLGDLISTQNKATSGYKKAGFSLASSGGNSYKIYAYHYDDFSFCGGVATDSWEYDCPGGAGSCGFCKEEIANITLTSPKVEITSPSSFEVYFFRPPNMGKALINGGAGPDPLEITLKHTKLPFEKKVIVAGTEAVRIYEE